MFKQARYTTSIVIAAGSLLVTAAATAQTAPVWTVEPAAQARVVIDPNTTIRAQLPRTLYSFNMRYNQFERELFDAKTWQPKTPITDELLPMPGVFFRYPGGIVANHYEWEKGALSRDERIAQRTSGQSVEAYPYFGPAEYLDWMKQLQGTAWWTLNLLGAGNVSKPVELPSATMAESNRNLAQYLQANYPAQTQWLYQLGNELERNRYEWPNEKYVSRSRDTINAILSVDPNAKFVAFMREFNIRYKYTRTGTSSASAFFKDVMTGLPMIKDFSLQMYYDGRLSPTARYIAVPEMLTRVQQALAMAKQARPGNYNVWITEHSKRMDLSGSTSPSPNTLDTGISAGDFLLGLAQVSEVKGAGLQGLQGGRATFFKDTLTGTPAFWALRMLETQPWSRVLASRTASPNKSGYPGGYDVRAVGFVDATGTKLGVSVVNRYNQPTQLEINYAPFKGTSKTVRHYHMSGTSGVDAAMIERGFKLATAPALTDKAFNSTGSVFVMLPPSSVSTITFE